MSDREYLSIDELSEYLGVDKKWLYARTSQAESKKLQKHDKPLLPPKYRFGKYLKFKLSEIDSWAANFKE